MADPKKTFYLKIKDKSFYSTRKLPDIGTLSFKVSNSLQKLLAKTIQLSNIIHHLSIDPSYIRSDIIREFLRNIGNIRCNFKKIAKINQKPQENLDPYPRKNMRKKLHFGPKTWQNTSKQKPINLRIRWRLQWTKTETCWKTKNKQVKNDCSSLMRHHGTFQLTPKNFRYQKSHQKIHKNLPNKIFPNATFPKKTFPNKTLQRLSKMRLSQTRLSGTRLS